MTSSRKRVAGGLTVRGTCAEGHVTEASTDAGRTTWEGTCAEDACELPVKARTRVAAAPAPPATEEPPAPPAKTAAPSNKPKVKQVDYDAQPPKREQRRRTRTDDDNAANNNGDGDGAQQAEEEPPAGGTVHRPRKRRRAAEPRRVEQEPAARSADGRGIRERITGRRQEGTPARPRREFRLPY